MILWRQKAVQQQQEPRGAWGMGEGGENWCSRLHFRDEIGRKEQGRWWRTSRRRMINSDGKCVFGPNGCWLDMEAISCGQEQMKNLVQGAITPTGSFIRLQSVCALHQNVITYRNRHTWLREWICMYLHSPTVSKSQAVLRWKHIQQSLHLLLWSFKSSHYGVKRPRSQMRSLFR